MMNCPPSPNYSSPVEYQYYLAVALKWKPPREYHYPTYPHTTNPPTPPPPKKKKNKKAVKKIKTNPRIPGENDKKKKKKKKRDLSL